MHETVSDLLCQPNSAIAVVLWMCVSVAVVVFGVMIYSILAFRKPQGVGANFGLSKVTEAMWAIIPIVIVCSAALPALQTLTGNECTASIVSVSQE